MSLSSDVLPEMKEYERTTTTTVNAYAKPVTARYLTRVEERLSGRGFAGELLMMLSSGGINSVAFAREFPVQIIESGPAAGTLGAAHYARLASLDKVLAFDMGGTTAKLALVENGRALRTSDFEVAHVHRFKPGSGIPVRVPGPTTSGLQPKALRHISSTIGCIGGTTFETIPPPTRSGSRSAMRSRFHTMTLYSSAVRPRSVSTRQ